MQINMAGSFRPGYMQTSPLYGVILLEKMTWKLPGLFIKMI
ncbi:Uncharacterised protein [Klebsiella pneumoniae]|nr:Uncharacterised protein [Klebsiella pneumoniae]